MAGITQKSCVTLFGLWSFKKTVVGYIGVKQQETYEKLKNRDWYRKWYWYIINATTANDNNNNNDKTVASTATAVTATTNKNDNNNNINNNNNNNDNVIIIKLAVKMKSGCALKKIEVAIYIVRLIFYSVKNICSLTLC